MTTIASNYCSGVRKGPKNYLGITSPVPNMSYTFLFLFRSVRDKLKQEQFPIKSGISTYKVICQGLYLVNDCNYHCCFLTLHS